MGIKQLDARHEKIDQLREKARARVDSDTVLRQHSHFLVDSPHFLLDPTLFLRLPRDRDEMDLCWARLERHYCWVCSACCTEILRWTVARISKYREYLKGYIDSRRHEIESCFSYVTEMWQWLLLQDILDLIDNAEKALRQGQIVEAENDMTQAWLQANRCSFIWSIMKRQESLAKTGKRVKNGQKNSLLARRGYFNVRRRHWRRWQEYIDDLHAKQPNDLFSWLISDASEEFGVSIRILFKRVKKSW